MGTTITLEITGLTIDWSKNVRGNDHGPLFQEIDRKRIHSDQIDYNYFEENDEDPGQMESAFVRRLKDILPRLDLLGFTRQHAKLEYQKAAEAYREEYREGEDESSQPLDIMTFEEFCNFVDTYAIETLDDVYDPKKNNEQIRGRFSDDSIAQRLPRSSPYDLDFYSERSYFGALLGFLSPYSILRVLSENARNREAEVIWQYGPLVESGWANRLDFAPHARRRQTFLVATEGSSDAHILNHAFSLLRPGIQDFFRFIDVKEGHPFSGAGNLIKFAEGLAKIDVHNQIVFLFDNDAEGYDACRRIKNLILPLNMRAIMLPELEQFRAFPARGPQGIVNSDINKRAAAIECYLDFNSLGNQSPHIVWTNYKKDLEIYHGALDNKETYTKAFLRQTTESIASNAYDVNKLQVVLDTLIAECSSIAENTLTFEE